MVYFERLRAARPSGLESRGVTTAIIDYGSGNLHSAQKAFERAARETGVTDAIIVTNDPDAVRRAERVVPAGRRRLCRLPRRPPCAAGPLRGAARGGHQRAAGPFSAFASACSSWRRAVSNMARRPGLDWIGGDVVAIEPGDPSLKNSAHGLEHADARASASASSPASRRARRAFTPISSTPIT